MLQRPDRADAPGESRRQRYRRRQALGLGIAPVEFDATIVDFLVRTSWLPADETHDRALVGRAIAALIKDSARR